MSLNASVRSEAFRFVLGFAKGGMRVGSRRSKALVIESFKHLHEQFVHDGVVYRFDAKPVLRVLNRVQTTAQRKISAVIGILPVLGGHHYLHHHPAAIAMIAVWIAGPLATS